MPDFGFVGAAYQAQSIYQDYQDCINWYPEIDSAYNRKTPEGAQGREVIALYPTPGYTIRATASPGAGLIGSGTRALWALPGGQKLLWVCGNTLYSVNTSWTATAVGTLNPGSGPVSLVDNGTSAYLCDGGSRYKYDYGTTGNFSVVTDGPFTGGSTVDMLDGYFLYTQASGTGNQFAATGSLSTATPVNSFGTKFSAPDNVQAGIAVNRNYFLIGERTTEVYIDTGSFPFPFQIIAGTMMQHGTIAPFSIARLGESFAMLSQDTRGQAVVVQMNGFVPVRISTHAIEWALAQYSKISDAVAFSYQDRGHEFYVLNFPTADATWVYDLATQLWHKRAYRDAGNAYHRARANCAAAFNGSNVVGDWQNGNLYTYSQTTYSDFDGSLIPCVRRAPHLTTDLRRQYFHDLQIQFQPGVGLTGNLPPNAVNYVSYPGTGGSYASTPNAAPIQITGDIDIRVYAAATNWTPAGTQNLMGKWVSTGNQKSYGLQVRTDGTLQIEWTTDGATNITANSSVAIPVANGAGIWVRATLQVNDGAGNKVITFYTSTDSPSKSASAVNWTQLGSKFSFVGTTSIFNSNSPLEIGSQNNGLALTVFSGKLYQVAVYNGINGTLAASFNAADTNAGPSWNSIATGETWTLNGNATLVNTVPVAGANPQALLRWSDDGGSTWTQPHGTSIGAAGRYKNRAIWRRLGHARDRIFEVTVTDPVNRVIISANLNATPGAA